MKNLIDRTKTAVLVVALSLLWGACASSTSRAPETTSDSRAEVPREDLVIQRALLSIPNEKNIDVTEQVRPILEGAEKMTMRPGLFGPEAGALEKRAVAVDVSYTLRGNDYSSSFHQGQEISRAALLQAALRRYNGEPTHTLLKRGERVSFVYVELRSTRTRLSTYSKGTREAPLNRAWFLKKDGSVLNQRSVCYFCGGTGIAGPESIVHQDEFEFDPVSPEELGALVIYDGEGVSCFELKTEDWSERAKPWTLSHW